jgi:hypothetical protein
VIARAIVLCLLVAGCCPHPSAPVSTPPQNEPADTVSPPSPQTRAKWAGGYASRGRLLLGTVLELYNARHSDHPVTADVVVDADNRERFGFYHPLSSDATNRIVLGLPGVHSLFQVAEAVSLGEHIHDQKWTDEYLLYMRRVGDWTTLRSPLAVYGKTDPAFEVEIAEFRTRVYDLMVAFVIAHELGHIALGHNLQGLDPTDPASLGKLRAAETEADQFAIQLLATKEAYERGLGPSGVATLFVSWTIINGIYEEDHSDHPLDLNRCDRLVHFVDEKAGTFGMPPETLREFQEEILGLQAGIQAMRADPTFNERMNRVSRELNLSTLSASNWDQRPPH